VSFPIFQCICPYISLSVRMFSHVSVYFSECLYFGVVSVIFSCVRIFQWVPIYFLVCPYISVSIFQRCIRIFSHVSVYFSELPYIFLCVHIFHWVSVYYVSVYFSEWPYIFSCVRVFEWVCGRIFQTTWRHVANTISPPQLRTTAPSYNPSPLFSPHYRYPTLPQAQSGG
jgi:hypothetical protein